MVLATAGGRYLRRRSRGHDQRRCAIAWVWTVTRSTLAWEQWLCTV